MPPFADPATDPATNQSQLRVEARRPLITRFKKRIPTLLEDDPDTNAFKLQTEYLTWIEDLSAERLIRLDRAYSLADGLGRDDAEYWHSSYTTDYVLDSLLPMLEAEAAAIAIAKGPAN